MFVCLKSQAAFASTIPSRASVTFSRVWRVRCCATCSGKTGGISTVCRSSWYWVTIRMLMKERSPCYGKKDSSLPTGWSYNDNNNTLRHTPQPFYGPFFPDYPGEPKPEEIFFWTFRVQGKITEADAPTIRLGATPSGLVSNPSPSSPHFYARCPSCRSPPNLSWLWTGTSIYICKIKSSGALIWAKNRWTFQSMANIASVSKCLYRTMFIVLSHMNFHITLIMRPQCQSW